ncbi:MAG TPA: TonB-dependent receptor [Thermoanaerobaculia bacterium]|nr:TonB-dependent receptor [Thermoanaerobaculia bacterium]
MRTSRTLAVGTLLVFFIGCFIGGWAAPASAQTSTASIRGMVTDEQGQPVAGAEVSAVGVETGFVKSVRSRADGSFLLPGLVPGPYRVVVSSPAHQPRSSEITLLVGQTTDLEFRLSPGEVFEEQVTVVSATPVEMKTHQVVTNVTPQQIEELPQNNRNFLNFAELAPGLRVSDDEFRQTFAAGAQTANAVNVFVDGVSFKNDVLQGGVVGQDASRGNPFPQNAVQEFRVLTQNYSAEFQKSSSAVITAVTKSGTNTVTGDVFGFWQDKGMVERDPFAAPGTPRPEYERLQGGLSIGGPFVRDRFHYFLSAELNDQDRVNRVALGGGGSPELRQQFLRFEGEFVSPFESKLLFAKGSYQPVANQLWEVSAFVRDETDERGFGGQTSFESAEEIVNDVGQLTGRHQYTAANWLNEASLGYQDFKWNPRPLNEQSVGLNYQGIIRVGGRDTEQNFDQQRISLRNDFTSFGLGGGAHLLKVGGNVDYLEYDVFKRFAGNPVYQLRQTENYEFPFQANFGLGDPSLGGTNTQIGLYVQDDWNLSDQLTLDLGVRWDYESDMFGTDYVTPQRIRTDWGPVLLERFGQDFLDTYFTDGSDRDGIYDMFAPRLGVTYDLFSNGETILYGGWGRFYDRILYNNTLDERFRLQYSVGVFRFSEDGSPSPEGFSTVAWQPRYLTIAGLQEILATGITGNPEVFLIENDTEAPYADQWNVGVRHSFGNLVASLAYGNVRSYNGFTFIRGDLRDDGNCCLTLVDGYSRLILSNDDVRTWYDAIYVTLDKPFTSSSRWGGQLAYTYSDAEQIGGDLFSLDFPRPADYPRYPTGGVEEHRLVASGLLHLPWNVNLGSVLEYGSGLPFNIDDRSLGEGVNERVFRRNAGEGDDHLRIDLRLEKAFTLQGRFAISVIGEVFNVFDEEFFTNYDGFLPPLTGSPNPTFGEPRAIVGNSQRRYQVGARVRF